MTKLTQAQLRVLRHLRDGDQIRRHWSKLFGVWHVHGDWGSINVSAISISRLECDGFVTISVRMGDWRYARLTEQGRAAVQGGVA